jgi:hypothetical protein
MAKTQKTPEEIVASAKAQRKLIVSTTKGFEEFEIPDKEFQAHVANAKKLLGRYDKILVKRIEKLNK